MNQLHNLSTFSCHYHDVSPSLLSLMWSTNPSLLLAGGRGWLRLVSRPVKMHPLLHSGERYCAGGEPTRNWGTLKFYNVKQIKWCSLVRWFNDESIFIKKTWKSIRIAWIYEQSMLLETLVYHNLTFYCEALKLRPPCLPAADPNSFQAWHSWKRGHERTSPAKRSSLQLDGKTEKMQLAQ